MPVDQTTEDRIPELHALYERLTGLQVKLTMEKIATWREWSAQGWSREDLALVIGNLKRREYKTTSGFFRRVAFRWLIGDIEFFEEVLAESKALTRRCRVIASKESVLRATGRTTNTAGAPAKSAEQIMRENTELKKLLEVRDKL